MLNKDLDILPTVWWSAFLIGRFGLPEYRPKGSGNHGSADPENGASSHLDVELNLFLERNSRQNSSLSVPSNTVHTVTLLLLRNMYPLEEHRFGISR